MTYEQAWQKITTAYVNNELRPFENCACFVGNLLGGAQWAYIRCFTGKLRDPARHTFRGNDKVILASFKFIKDQGYAPGEIVRLEEIFMDSLRGEPDHITEDSLFAAMVAGLEELRKIHIAKGENVEPIVLQKRQLTLA